MKQRLAYIDTTKGLLILLMIWYHTPPAVQKNVELCNPYMGEISYYTRIWFECFFMPAFFIITGFCSGFVEERKSFYIKMFKTIILPVSVISYIRCCIFDFSFNPLHLIGPYKPTGNWFIIALIIGRTLFYELHIIFKKQSLWLLVVLSIFAIFAMVCRDNNIVQNPFYWKQGLCAAMFIGIGNYIRKFAISNRTLAIMSIAYIILISIINSVGLHRTVMVISLSVEWYEFVQFIILALTGTAFVIFCAKHIKIKLVEHIGKHSLVLYLIQWPSLVVLSKLFAYIYDVTSVKGCWLIVLTIFPLSIIVCLIFVKCFDTKYGRYIMGKF